MRYLGNKESITNYILEVLKSHNLLKKKLIFFDAFCGTGSICDSLKDKFNIVVNDNLECALDFTLGRLYKNSVSFAKLGFNPITFFNAGSETFDGFFSKNYCQKSGRMYFNDFNAERIDYFRKTIESWKTKDLIDDKEYYYLLACLLESVSKVANVAGVYGAYLKKWDSRAVKDIKFLEVESNNKNCSLNVSHFNDNLSKIIENVECDILYLDPPYTKNKYSVQYHLLETLIRNDNPELKGITGGRDMSFVDNSWSCSNKVEIEFESTVAKTKAKYVLLSYSSDGIMSKDFILNVMRRYCLEDSVEILEIPYKKYRNFKTESTEEHYEYLFYGEKKPKDDIVYYCPLNYMGGKSTVINDLKPHLNGKDIFFDLMAGGFNVGINASGFKKFVYNDLNYFVKDIVKMFKSEDTYSLLKNIENIIKKYALTKHGKEEYFKFRKDYNSVYRFRKDYAVYLFVLIMYGFQQQLRFNSNHEFNNPVGESGYNDSIKEKIVSFSRRIKELNVSFKSVDYEELYNLIDENSLVYIDPPYLVTLGSYNDGKRGFKGWNIDEEKRLISFFDKIKSKGCKLIISNIIDYKGKKNDLLYNWIKRK